MEWRCERGDSNPHGAKPRDPKSRASTSSATFARGARSRCSAKDNTVGNGINLKCDVHQRRTTPKRAGPGRLPRTRECAELIASDMPLLRHPHVHDPLVDASRSFDTEVHDLARADVA